MRNLAVPVSLLLLAVSLTSPPAKAQSKPSFAAPAAYNAQPGTVPAGVASGVFNDAEGLLDFAVLEQKPNGGTEQVEVFHGKSDGSFCTNCNNANPNPDVILLGPSGSSVKGNFIAVGQFRTAAPRDIAVATSTGIVFLQNNGSGIFTLSANAISAASGFLSLVVGQFGANSNYDIAAVTPSVSGSISFTVFFGDGSGAFPTQSTPISVSNTYSRCSAILQGNFQGQTIGADLVLLCNTPSAASVLVYLNSGSGVFAYSQTPYTGGAVLGELPGVTLGTLNKQTAIFVSPVASSFMSYQSNGLAGQSNAVTSVSMIPVGLAPRGSLTILYDPPTGAIDFATSSSGVSVSTFTSYTQSGTSVNGTWSSTQSLGTGGVLAVGFSPNLTQGAAYVVVSAGVHTGTAPNFEPYVDERSISVFLVTLNTNGIVATTTVPPVYSSPGGGSSFPPSFAMGDFNGDGIVDLAVSGADGATGNATLTIYLANSDGSIPTTTSLPVVTVNNTPYSGVAAVIAGKFRPPQGGKNIYDLAVFSFGQIAILTSNGDGTFGSGNSYPLSGDPNYPGFFYSPGLSGIHRFAAVLTAADVNGDGIDDIILTLPEDNCNGSGAVSQGAAYSLISNGDGSFQNPVFVVPPVVNPVSVTAAKFFGGSLPDIAFSDGGEICSGNSATTAGTAVGILQNNGNGKFINPKVILTQASDLGVPNITAVASADLNGDGSPDLIVSSTNGIQVLLNQGGGSFTATAQGVVPLYAGDVVPGPLCNATDNYVGCVIYDSQVATGSFFATGENDVVVSTSGVVYVFQNQNNSGTLLSPSLGFVAGPDSTISAVQAGSNGLNNVLVATSQGTADLVNSGVKGGASFANYSNIGPIDFVTNVNTTNAQQLVLTNTGGSAFTISSVVFSGTSNAFSVANVVCNGATDFPFSSVSLGPGQSCTITLQFAPGSVGNGQAELLTILDAASNSNATAAPQSNGQSFLLLGDATQSTGPSFANYSNVGRIDFATNVNTTSTQQLVLTNTGGSAFTISGIVFSGTSNAFSVANVVCNGATDFPFSSVSLGPGQSCTITLQFAPRRYGNGQAELLTILDTASNSNATTAPRSNGQSLLLLGDSTRPYARFSVYGTPTTGLNVGTDPENTAITSPITVMNTGNGPLTLNLVYFNSILGPPVSNGFSYTQVICNGVPAEFPVTLNYNQFCTITVQFDPPAAGNFSANLYVLDDAKPGESNLPNSPAGSIYLQAFPLSGTGFAPKADLSISAYGTGHGYTGIAYTFATQMINNGPDSATNLTITYSFSSPVQFVSLGDGYSLGCPLPAVGSTISSLKCNFGTFGVGSSIVFFLLVTPLTPGTLTMTATIDSGAFDPNFSNNSAQASATVTSPPLPPSPVSVPSISFPSTGSPTPVGHAPSAVAVADFNGDGNDDLAVVNVKDNTISILLGNNNGSFSPAKNSPYSTSPFGIANAETPISIAVGDFNGDGKLDIAVTTIPTGFFSALGGLFNGHIGGGVSILLGNGDGTFRGGGPFNNPNNFGTNGDLPTGIAVADFNGDGNLDLAITNLNSNNVSIMLGDGQGNFTQPVLCPTGTHPAGVVAGYFHGTLDPIPAVGPDLAVANADDGTVVILRNFGLATLPPLFVPGLIFPVGVRPVAIASADINSDGIPDLVVANYSSSTVSVLLGNSFGIFASAKNFPVGSHPISLVLSDFDRDGTPDVLVANNTGNLVSLLLGKGGGNFAPAKNFAVLQAPQSLALGSFAGKSGFAVLSTALNQVAVYQDEVHCPAVASGVSVARSLLSFNGATKRNEQTVTLTNTGGTIAGPIYLLLASLNPDVGVYNASGLTSCGASKLSPYVSITGPLLSGASAKIVLQFVNPSKSASISYTPVVLAGSPMP